MSFKGGKLYISASELETIYLMLGDNPAFSGFWRKVAGMQGSASNNSSSKIDSLYGVNSASKRLGNKVNIPDDIALIQIAMMQGLEISEEEEDKLNVWMTSSFNSVALDDI